MSDLLALGISHKSAPVELRERLAVASEDKARLLRALRDEAGLREVMVVSTCNRVEVYGVAGDVTTAARGALGVLSEIQGVDASAVQEHLMTHAAADAARHIFRVAASLESLVVGEPQILGQVKEAYGEAKDEGYVGPVLDRCLSLAFKSAKRARSETEIARGGASVPSVAVDLATSIFGDLRDSSVLVVGAGEMAEQAAVHLRAAGVPQMVVVNRSEERGRALAGKIEGHYEPWERLPAELGRADVVVTSTGSKLPIIDRAMLKPVIKARRQRPLFLVDIAVPRDVDPDVARLDHIFAYNVDDLQGIVHDNLRSRQGEATRAGVLVDAEVQGFTTWMRSRGVGPLIGRLQSQAMSIAETEVERTLAKLPALDDKQREAVARLGRSVVQKLLHKPMSNVRRAAAEPVAGFDAAGLADALSALFELESAADAEAQPRTPAAAPAVERPPNASPEPSS